MYARMCPGALCAHTRARYELNKKQKFGDLAKFTKMVVHLLFCTRLAIEVTTGFFLAALLLEVAYAMTRPQSRGNTKLRHCLFPILKNVVNLIILRRI
jgi:hypothetical protein